jgi:hypothetical protein
LRRYLNDSLLQNVGILLLYLLAAVAITYPLITQIDSVLVGFAYGDAYEHARHVWWTTHALRIGQPPFFQPLLGYPDGISGATLQAIPLQLFPAALFHLVMPLPVAFNLHILMTLALNGYAMYLFARALIDDRRAAFVAGIVFMAYPTMQGHLGVAHSNVLIQWGLPLYAWALYRLTVQQRRRDLVAAALLFVVGALGHTLQVVYALLPVTAFYGVWSLWRRDWRAAGAIIGAAALGALLLGVYLLPVLGAATSYASTGGAVRYSADALAIVSPSFFHPLYSGLDYPRRVLGINLDEGAAYVGIIAGTLAIISLVTVGTRYSASVLSIRSLSPRAWLALAIVAYILSLGPLLKVLDQPVTVMADGYVSYIALPWAALQDLPLLDLARTPARFNVVIALALAVMSAGGAAWLLARLRRPLMQRIAALALTALILFDYQVFFPLPTTSAALPAAIAALDDGSRRAVFNIPWDNLLAAKEALYLQTAHGLPMIGGQVTRETPVDPALLTLLQTTLDPALLRAAGADVVLVHKAYTGDVERVRAALGDPLYEDERFAVFQTPAADDVPAFTTLPTPQTAITNHADSYVYAPSSGWALLNVSAAADGREMALTLDGVPLWRGTVTKTTLAIPLPMPQAGYYSAALALEPPCPAQIPVGQVCRSVALESLDIGAFVPAEFAPAQFQHGARLGGATLAPREDDERSVTAWLWWAFDAPISDQDVRYVHVLDAGGTLVTQIDTPIGIFAAGDGWSEALTLALPDDAVETYRVVVGWYRYPELTPYGVVGGDEAYVEIGTFERPD